MAPSKNDKLRRLTLGAAIVGALAPACHTNDEPPIVNAPEKIGKNSREPEPEPTREPIHMNAPFKEPEALEAGPPLPSAAASAKGLGDLGDSGNSPHRLPHSVNAPYRRDLGKAVHGGKAGPPKPKKGE